MRHAFPFHIDARHATTAERDAAFGGLGIDLSMMCICVREAKETTMIAADVSQLDGIFAQSYQSPYVVGQLVHSLLD